MAGNPQDYREYLPMSKEFKEALLASVPDGNKRRKGMDKTHLADRQPLSKTPGTKKSQNQSILNFFEKSDKTNEYTRDTRASMPLFFSDGRQGSNSPELPRRTPGAARDAMITRYNEDKTPVKRRRTDQDFADFVVRTPSPGYDGRHREDESRAAIPVQNQDQGKPLKYRGGFLVDSSDEEDGDEVVTVVNGADSTSVPDEVGNIDPGFLDAIHIDTGELLKSSDLNNEETTDRDRRRRTDHDAETVPELTREATSMLIDEDFGDDDFENEECFEDGEEYMERRWMEEQREMEMELDEDSKSESGGESIRTPRSMVEYDALTETEEGDGVAVCPICNGNLRGLSEIQASSHVNACLDGDAEPLPKESEFSGAIQMDEPGRQTPGNRTWGGSDVPAPKRFQRAAIARPAQANPFSLTKDTKGASAFVRLMSGHAEDAAWAEAAANEAQSRGKPAHQRTCPFYKIIPGFHICVDAFRYGKVEGQNAYFLSHFHSDHYIGLTSSWCHGPIYASKVTCNLILQQLKVDPIWVVPLEFEKKAEVPDTKGVFVTMIPANHCPGSSLFLFEKTTGKNRDGSPKSTRILHCGDFRACPAHVGHPLLRPDVVDGVTGQTRQQVINTCYLDTTYLTPKYAFPSQQDVIDACAQMCISLSKEIVDPEDGWERTKAERASSAMKEFLARSEKNVIKEEDPDARQPKTRGRLLVVIGTYSIGKERICLGIAKALNSKIYAPPSKMRVCLCLEDAELNARLTNNPLEAQVHMQTLMEIRAETLRDYLVTYKGHFARVVGFRPTGWNYRSPTSRFTESPAVSTVLYSDGWKSRFTMRDLVPQRGSTRESSCFGVPYSEHSSFRELTMFCCALRINRIVPTVNVGSARTREKMKAWIEKWDAEKRKNGLFKVEAGAEGWGSGDGQLRYGV
ncbi:uncharacterized protein Z518_09399 [Rhinocladiella mackenziei CBS 650.93]|uniref:DNA repair metallo-beta-lactamase domain-containing protein n=1 Tax=Rhinocladiella mackenziei CBS 650.93 TaxID=1442369 RepID=A0A0D2GTL8_9EURO|nr:uncharacterized protein Z518_09399 [Rhinocladiella mackenziei CBS 650.93]KIX01673.1 hypothetical protein Z518_09399 [Rhinocladiella mackenziei CBS 650.93]